MSDFRALKRQRADKSSKSFIAKSEGESSKNAVDATMDVDAQEQNATKAKTTPSYRLYAAVPESLEVRTSAERGRGIYSKYARRPGDVLFSVKPHVSALSTSKLDAYCSSCCAPRNNTFQRCTGCKVVYYCDSTCQSRDWAFHKHECTAIQRWSSAAKKEDSESPIIPADALRCLGRMVWRKQKLGQDSIWAKEIDALESHRTSISKDPNTQDSQMYAQLAHALVNFLGIASPQDMASYGMQNAADLVDLISRLTTNTFTISTPALEPLGACVSPSVALINHSCDPNVVVVFPRPGGETQKSNEPLMQVIALKHIAVEEEILASYIDTTLPRAKRQEVLQKTYHFSCQCVLCLPFAETPVDMREAMWCPKKCGGVCSLPTEENSLTRCRRCKTPVKDTDAVLDALRVGQEALDKAEALQVSDPDKSIQLTSKLVPILISAGLVPGSHPLLALSRLNASLLITHLPSARDPNVEEVLSPGVQGQHEVHTDRGPKEAQEQLDEAIRAATRASTGLSQILVEGHPVRSVALAELGKLLSVDEPDPVHMHEPSSPSGTNASSRDEETRSRAALGLTLASPAEYPPSGPPRLKLAYETLLRARTELLIGFGGGTNQGGEVGRSVRSMAADLEKEMQVWKAGVKNVLEQQPVRRI